MGLYEQADAEAENLSEQLENGEITQKEYDRYIRDLRNELRDIERNY